MFSSNGWYFFGVAAALTAVAISSSVAGCQSNGDTGGTDDGAGGDDPSTSGNASGGGMPTGTSTTGSSGGGSASGGASPCDGQEATIQDVTTGTIGPAVDVKLKGVVAMSQKFLVSKSKSSGSCLWGVFVSAPGLTQTAPNSGVLILSYGNKAETNDAGTAYCPKLPGTAEGPVGDQIPDDVMPGDVLDVIGETDYFLLDACGSETNGSQVAQRQVAKVCSAVKTGTAAVPAAKILTAGDVAKLGSPNDTAFHDQWGGTKVRIENVTAVEPTVGMYGIITLEGSGLHVTNDLWYRPYSMNMCHKGPTFEDTNAFTFIEGFSYMDYCTWSLTTNDKCADTGPASEDCAGATSCPPDLPK